YVAKNEGLLSFDGSEWNHYESQKKIFLRAVATDVKGKIYIGGFDVIGYWSYESKGMLKYKSLIPLLPKGTELSDEIWKIYVDGNRVLFQSFSRIFIYQDNKIRLVDDKEARSQPYLFLHHVKDRFFVEVINIGLYELKGEKI